MEYQITASHPTKGTHTTVVGGNAAIAAATARAISKDGWIAHATPVVRKP